MDSPLPQTAPQPAKPSFVAELKKRHSDQAVRRRLTIAWIQTKPIAAILEACEIIKNKYGMVSYLHFDANYVGVTLAVRELEGLKDPKLAELIYGLVHHNPTRESTEDYAGNLERDYRFSWEARDEHGILLTLQVRVEAFFKADSETCRKVIVGYKEIPAAPEPIYELRCEEPVPIVPGTLPEDPSPTFLPLHCVDNDIPF